jgi:hypothetical protein
MSESAFYPKTKLGETLLELRRNYLSSGGILLSSEELDKELRLRREDKICDGEDESVQSVHPQYRSRC